MKRKSRKLSQDTKDKISNSLKGKNKTDEHKNSISKGMTEYWKTIPDE